MASKEGKRVTCPLLAEIVMEYCEAFPVRKPIPKHQITTPTPCSGEDHKSCPHFLEAIRRLQCAEEALGTLPVSPDGGADLCRPPGGSEPERKGRRKRAEVWEMKGFFLRPDRFYHAGHTWVMPRRNAMVRIGIDDFGSRLLSGVQHVKLPSKRSVVRQGESVVEIKCGGKRARLVSPVDGLVTAVNHRLAEAPSVLESDPYGTGWLFSARVLDGRFVELPTEIAAVEWLKKETDRLSTFMSSELGATAADGGELIPRAAETLSRSQWESLLRTFFGTSGSDDPRA